MKKFILYLLVCFITFTLVSCGGDNKEPNGNIDANGNIITDAPTVVSLPSVVNKSIELPTSKDGYEITWESTNEELLTKEGHLFACDEATEVLLYATVTKDGKEFKELLKVTVDINKDNSFKGAYGFYIDVVKNTYSKDSSFNYSKYRTYTPTYESMNPEVITNEGKITQTDHPQQAVIKVTITEDKTNEQVVYYVRTTIAEWSKYTYVDVIAEWLDGKVNVFDRVTVSLRKSVTTDISSSPKRRTFPV